MIERGHVHYLQPRARHERPDGAVEVYSGCICGLEERKVFDGDRPIGIRFRYGGLWFEPLDLLRLLPLPVQECPICLGEPTLERCPGCEGMGVVDSEELVAIEQPGLNVIG